MIDFKLLHTPCQGPLHIYPAREGVPVQPGTLCRCGQRKWGCVGRHEENVKVVEVIPEKGLGATGAQ